MDPRRDGELAAAGLVAFEDPKTGEVIWRNTGRGFLSAFKAHTSTRRQEREKSFRRMKLDFINLQTGEPYTTALMKYFRLRARRH